MSEGQERRRVWKVAEAKAELSKVLGEAQSAPQVVSNRGEPVAVVVGVRAYETLEEQASAGSRAARWQRFLDASAEVRRSGGSGIAVPSRKSRQAPPLGR